MFRAAPALLVLLAACGRGSDQPQDLNSLDRELTANATAQRDPAVAQALHDQIMVDPTLAQQSNANAVKPPPRPDPGSVPPEVARPDPVDARTLRHAPAVGAACPDCRAKAQAYTLGALAAGQRRAAVAHCADVVHYSAGWANRLPADLPLYPDARVAEAAGNDAGDCRLRVVSFATSAAPAKVIDWYYTRAAAAGYRAEHQLDGATEVLGGTRGDDAFVAYVAGRPGGGADVDLVSNAGR